MILMKGQTSLGILMILMESLNVFADPRARPLNSYGFLRILSDSLRFFEHPPAAKPLQPYT